MARKKTSDRSKLYDHPIRTRVTGMTFRRLKSMVGNSNCHTIGEVARRILSKEKILAFYKDKTMDATMEELSSIRKELNSIGVNINQITHSFHASPVPQQKVFLAMKVAGRYEIVDGKVERLLKIVSQLSIKWLQK